MVRQVVRGKSGIFLSSRWIQVPPEQVQGDYEISFVWNVHVPGKPEFEAFQARKQGRER